LPTAAAAIFASIALNLTSHQLITSQSQFKDAGRSWPTDKQIFDLISY
jgi:hypothetical protein